MKRESLEDINVELVIECVDRIIAKLEALPKFNPGDLVRFAPDHPSLREYPGVGVVKRQNAEHILVRFDRDDLYRYCGHFVLAEPIDEDGFTEYSDMGAA